MDDNNNKKLQEKESLEKAGATAGRALADYYTGGEYEQIRNKPIVGDLAKGAENLVGKKVAKSPGAKHLGGLANSLNESGALDGANSALGAMGGGIDSKDVSSMNNLQKNSAGHSKDYGSLPKKDGLDDDSEASNEKDDSNLENDDSNLENDDSSNDNNDSGEEKKEKGKKKKKNGEGPLKDKLKKMKIYLIIGGVAAGLFVGLFLVMAIIAAVENFTLGLVSFFGVPESTKEESGNVPGLYDDDKYLYDEDGNLMGREELIDYLKNNSNCDGNIWTSVADGWNSFWGNKISDVCELIRYVKKETEKNGVDEALVVSTIFYGYDTRPEPADYINQDDAPDEIPASEHFQNFTEILQDKNIHITRSGIDDIIKNAHATSKSYYYVWELEETKDDDGNVTKLTGKCVYKESTSEKYNLDKWKVFMRFGEAAASKYDSVVLKSKNYESSSDECKNADNAYSDEKLQEQVELAAAERGSNVDATVDMSSVEKARNSLENPDETATEVFFQAADLNTKEKDVFNGYDGIEFDYTNGYAYQHFPSFKPSMESGGAYYGKVNIQYDSTFTPKEVESLIQSIVTRKTNMNSALLRKDPDVPDDFGNGGFSGVVTGANCMPYLTSSLNEIQVTLTDCYGSYMDTVSFEDYIIGVANGEVSNKHDDYVLSQMVAAISYALKRHNNYTKGSTITMRSGTCDQVYCSLMRGCYGKNTPVGTCNICNSYYIGGSKASPGLYPKYQALYEIASDYLLVKDGAPFSAHYVSTIQNRWYQKAVSGKSFTQIMQEEYEDEGATLIRCSDHDSEVENPEVPETTEEEKQGNKATSEYPNVSPDLGTFYGFSYKDGSDNTHVTINPDWKDANLVTISPECPGNRDYENKTYTIHKNALTNFKKAFKNVCKILTNGVKITNGDTCQYTIDDISDGTVFIERKLSGGTFDLHAYGLSQDLNYSKKFTINGKEYTPYNTRELSDYLEFVNAIGGKEENCKNINYILWAYAYKDAGFYWGGNYGRNGNSGSYDGKLFELKYK